MPQLAQSVVARFGELEQQLPPEALQEAQQLSEQIADPRTADADEIWTYMWDKPLYSNTKVIIGDNWAASLRPYMVRAWRDWGRTANRPVYIRHVGKGRRPSAFSAALPEPIEQTNVPMHRLFSIQRAAAALRKRASGNNPPYANLLNMDPREMVRSVRREMGFGWGPVTVLHFLTDLGLACKPDRHLVRTVRHLGMAIDLRETEVPNQSSAIAIVRWVRCLVERLDGSFRPHRLRYELLSNLVYGANDSSGFPADLSLINTVDKLDSRDDVSERLEAT